MASCKNCHYDLSNEELYKNRYYCDKGIKIKVENSQSFPAFGSSDFFKLDFIKGLLNWKMIVLPVILKQGILMIILVVNACL